MEDTVAKKADKDRRLRKLKERTRIAMTDLGSRRKMADKSGMVLDEGIDLFLMDPCCQDLTGS